MGLKNPICRVVLYEGAGTQGLGNEERFQLISALLEGGFPVAKAVDAPSATPTEAGPVVVLGRFSETLPSDEPGLVWRNIEGESAELTVTQLQAQGAATGLSQSGGWKPWFPVIDYDRCTNCMQCLSFCLFGVYGVDDAKRLQVQNQDNCKTNCPACSRVCPEAAIMFPKYKAGPINGEIVSDSDLNREKMKIDISALLGGDVYALLRSRSERAQSRFSKERDSDKALAERQKCLVKLGAMARDIPPEVLMSLPSPGEIARKAEEAAAKAKAALASAPTV